MATRRNEPETSTQALQQRQEQDQDQEQEQEQEQEKKKDKVGEGQSQQNQLGNSAIASMLNLKAGQDGQSFAPSGGGAGQSVRKNDLEKSSTPEFGGELPPDDIPLRLEDLTRSWNPKTTKSEDRPKYIEPMPDDDLPPEDESFIASIDEIPFTGPFPPIRTLDGLLQPSAAVIAASTARWAAAASRWASPTPGWQGIASIIRGNPPILQSADARVLPARAAVAALGSLMLTTSKVVTQGATIENAALIELTLELEGRAHRVANLAKELESIANKLPLSAQIIEERLPHGGYLTVTQPGTSTDAILGSSLERVAGWRTLRPTVPRLPNIESPTPSEDDPLGLDAVFSDVLGEPDHEEGAYEFALTHAERLAIQASITRIRFAAVSLVVGEVASLWSYAPTAAILEVAHDLDEEVNQALQTLLEVARAARKRSFAPPTVERGLRSGAKMVDSLRERGLRRLGAICAAMLPGEPSLEPREHDNSPFGIACGQCDWVHARSLLPRTPQTIDEGIAVGTLMALEQQPFSTQLEHWNGLVEQTQSEAPTSPSAIICRIFRAHALIQLGEYNHAVIDGDWLVGAGKHRRNGILVAEGALIGMEALAAKGRSSTAQSLRTYAARLCWDVGSRAGLTLLARWTEAPADPETFSPFFDYGSMTDEN